MTSRLKTMDKNGNIEPDLERQEIAKRKFIALVRFFLENELLTVKNVTHDADIINFEFKKNDFTNDGLQLVRAKESSWLNSKASGKIPPNTKILSKALAEIRGHSTHLRIISSE